MRCILRGISALYTLCFCDAFLIFMVILYHSIEATGILVMGRNVMWNEQVRLTFDAFATVFKASDTETRLSAHCVVGARPSTRCGQSEGPTLSSNLIRFHTRN